ncbi:hypothetical protein [Staphylococcus shinii]|uniref:hypothetical protein n=1 Tax=Staphylococcus shinii TaxID=2912228 RepID=UPI003EE9C126
MKKILSVALICLLIFLGFYFFYSITNKPADEKIKGTWTYRYDEEKNATLELNSNSDGMFIMAKGYSKEVYPLKKQTDHIFDFVLDGKDGKSYLYSVDIVDENHIIIKPDDENDHSLAEMVVGTNDLGSDDSKGKKAIELKKNE